MTGEPATTEERYLTDTYERTFEATVERVLDDRVVLDRTLFYPSGGGQPHDEGTLSFDGTEAAVADVRKKDTIYHILEGPVPAEGQQVSGRLDWDRRYAHMRYHTAQHVLSAVLLEEFDAETTGNQLYADRARIDCRYERFDDAALERIEAIVNDHLDRGLDVSWYTLDREEAADTLDPDRTRLHLLPDSITEVRIVEIEELDRTACAGTHVANTDEVGTMRIDGRETKGKEEERLRFVLE
ncbi:MAG: alanine--tRNA ligase-related protein [Halodesulfurarchaeum sp.]